MKKKLMATMVALSLSAPLWANDTVVITEPEVAAADMQMLFEQDAQALQVMALSPEEMQETQGAWNPFAAIVDWFKKPDVSVVEKVAVGVVLAAPVVAAGAIAMMTGVGEGAIGGAAVAAAGEAAEGVALLDAAAGAGRAAGGLAARRGVVALAVNTAQRIGMQIVTPAPRLPINPFANFNWNNWRLDGLARIRSVPTPIRNGWPR